MYSLHFFHFEVLPNHEMNNISAAISVCFFLVGAHISSAEILYALSITQQATFSPVTDRGLQGGSRLFPEVGFRTQRCCLYSLRCQRFRL